MHRQCFMLIINASFIGEGSIVKEYILLYCSKPKTYLPLVKAWDHNSLSSFPKGGHSNYGGNRLVYFQPTVNIHGSLGAQDVVFYNSRNFNLTKPSSLYPQDWSEFMCDLKAIEVMMSKNAIVNVSEDLSSLEIIGSTNEGLKIRIIYDIFNQRIKTHHPLVKEV